MVACVLQPKKQCMTREHFSAFGIPGGCKDMDEKNKARMCCIWQPSQNVSQLL